MTNSASTCEINKLCVVVYVNNDPDPRRHFHTALQERCDKEIVATETDRVDGANGVSDVSGRGEEPAAEEASERLEQVIVGSEHSVKIQFSIWRIRHEINIGFWFLFPSAGEGSAGTRWETATW